MLDLRHTDPSTPTRPVRDHGPRTSVRSRVARTHHRPRTGHDARRAGDAR